MGFPTMNSRDYEGLIATNIEIQKTTFETNSKVRKFNDQEQFRGKPTVLLILWKLSVLVIWIYIF
jgi:hypothetical protein